MSGKQEANVHPFVGLDLPHLIELQARIRGEHPFLHWAPFEGTGRTYTYSEFLITVQRVARAIKSRGVRKNDRVLIHLENCPEGIIAWFACAWLGATAVMTNARASAAELKYFSQHSKVVAAITQPRLLSNVLAACEGVRWTAVTSTDNGDPAPDADELKRCIPFSDLLREERQEPLRAPEPMLPVGIQYTSGTTSRPKGVVLTHANALWGGKVGAGHTGLDQSDIFLIHLPLYHIIGLSYGLLSTLWTGGTVVLMPRFSASRFWSVSTSHQCTWSAMVPFCLRALAEQPVPAQHSYRAWGNAFWSGSLERRYGISIFGWWGMTEIITHGIHGALRQQGHSMAIGRPAVEYELAIRRDDGTPVTCGETGHLFIRGVRGVSIFAEYLDDPQSTTDSFDENGFFKTGDLVTLHEDGFIQFADRAKDMLKVGGENVAASEIERVVQEVPGVREAAVVGRPHPMLGEVPIVFVVAASEARASIREDILSRCGTELASFKVPRAVYLMETLPRGLTDKISKVELRKLADSVQETAGAK